MSGNEAGLPGGGPMTLNFWRGIMTEQEPDAEARLSLLWPLS